MLWLRLVLILLVSWSLLFGCTALLAKKRLEESQLLANQQGLEFLALKIQQYQQMGGQLGSQFALTDLLPYPELRIRESHFADPYGQSYQFIWLSENEFELRSAGADQDFGSDQDVSMLIMLDP